MTRECQVRICERLGVKLPGPTRPHYNRANVNRASVNRSSFNSANFHRDVSVNRNVNVNRNVSVNRGYYGGSSYGPNWGGVAKLGRQRQIAGAVS